MLFLKLGGNILSESESTSPTKCLENGLWEAPRDLHSKCGSGHTGVGMRTSSWLVWYNLQAFCIWQTQATLSLDAKTGERVGVTAKVEEDGPDVLICSLREGTSESQSLDLIFDS